MAANTPAALVPGPQAGFNNPEFGATRPGDPLPPVPGTEYGDEASDDVWTFDPSTVCQDPSYAEVRETSADYEDWLAEC